VHRLGAASQGSIRYWTLKGGITATTELGIVPMNLAGARGQREPGAVSGVGSRGA
jgi:hypothetical protein